MDNDIIFMSVGVATDIFTDNVRNYYARYKYYFRAMPTNSTSLGGQIFYFMGIDKGNPIENMRKVIEGVMLI